MIFGEGGSAAPSARQRMQALLREAMQDGALGVSSSLSGPPGVWIDTDTLVALCETAATYGGSYSTHLRTEGLGVFDAVDEALEIGRRANVPVDIIHLEIAEHTMWGRMPDCWRALRRLARMVSRSRPTSIHTARDRTTWPALSRRGPTPAARPR